MVTWRDPQTVADQSYTLIKFIHTLDGIFLWEFFSTIGYEWDIVTRRRPWRWKMALYISCRLATLTAVICDLIGFNVMHAFNCRAWLLSLMFFSSAGLALASLLIIMRSIALWERRAVVVGTLFVVWLMNVAFLIYGMTKMDAQWNQSEKVCAITGAEKNRDSVIVTLCADVVFLLAMLGGVVRQIKDGPIWRITYYQGVIWIALATISQVLPVTFLSLDLNAPMNLMFQTPALILTTIAATRIYRGLQQRARKPVIGASYLSDFQFATNPEFTLDVRNRTTLNMRSGATTGTLSNLGLSSLDVQFPKSYGRYREEDLMEYPLTPISESATGLEDLVLEHGGQIAEHRLGRNGDLSEDLAMELGEPPRYSQYAHSLGSAGSGGRSGVDDSVVGGSSQARTIGYPPAILQGTR